MFEACLSSCSITDSCGFGTTPKVMSQCPEIHLSITAARWEGKPPEVTKTTFCRGVEYMLRNSPLHKLNKPYENSSDHMENTVELKTGIFIFVHLCPREGIFALWELFGLNVTVREELRYRHAASVEGRQVDRSYLFSIKRRRIWRCMMDTARPVDRSVALSAFAS